VLHNLYYSSDIIKAVRKRLEGHAASIMEMRTVCTNVFVNSDGKCPLAVGRRRWENNTEIQLKYCAKLWLGFKWLRKLY
jgi:hypothetical protein